MCKEREQAGIMFDRLKVKAPSMETIIVNLSGGNQQKVVLGKWLLAQPEILFVDEPTKGIDVCALRLKDIDWEKDCISIIQNKTKKPLILPLRASYGNDIADYILNERPGSGSDHVFLKTFAPFGRLGTGIVYEILKKLEELAGIKKRRKGNNTLSPKMRRISNSKLF